MSTILRALRRLEQDRASDEERPLHEAVTAPLPGEPLVRRRRWPVVAAIGLGAAASVTFFVWRTPPAEQEEAAVAARVRPAARAPGRTPAPTARPRAEEGVRSAGAVEPAPPSPSTPSADPRPPVVRPGIEEVARSARVVEVVAPGSATPKRDSAEVAVVESTPPELAAAESVPAPEPAAPVQRAPIPAEPAEAPAPAEPATATAPAPVETVARAPSVTVARTVWHPDPAQRLAVVEVEGRSDAVELREGDAVGTLVVKSIEPSTVLFLQGAVEIRRRVGESP